MENRTETADPTAGVTTGIRIRDSGAVVGKKGRIIIMNQEINHEKPEIYALRQDGGTWQISQRDFLRAAGIGAAALGAGLSSGCSAKEDLIEVTATPALLSDLCKSAPAHEAIVEKICLSDDDRYLVSCAFNTMKCWDLEHYSLLGSLYHSPLRDFEIISTGLIDGKSCVFGNGNGSEHIQYFELPFTDGSERKELPLEGYFSRYMILDSTGNFYGVRNDGIYYSGAADNYASTDLFYELDNSNYEKSIKLIDDERKMFIQFMRSGPYGVLDLADKTLKQFEGKCYLYAVCPDGKQALIYDDEIDMIRFISLADGSVIWEKEGKNTGFGRTNGKRIKGLAVSADGTAGFLVGDISSSKGSLKSISLADGSLQDSLELGRLKNLLTPIVLTKDGSRLVLAHSENISVISLPDLKIIGCLTDVSAMPDNTEALEISETDPDTGAVYTYTLPGGAEIPAGAVCICNTVSGKISTACTCDGHKCSCDAHRSGSGSHYWHPN